MPEGEWDAFMAALRAPLPTTFRVNGSGRFAADLRDRLAQGYFAQLSGDIEVGLCNRRAAYSMDGVARGSQTEPSTAPLAAGKMTGKVSPKDRLPLSLPQVDGELLKPPAPLPWYPERLAWQLDFTRAQLRKLPALKVPNPRVSVFLYRQGA